MQIDELESRFVCLIDCLRITATQAMFAILNCQEAIRNSVLLEFASHQRGLLERYVRILGTMNQLRGRKVTGNVSYGHVGSEILGLRMRVPTRYSIGPGSRLATILIESPAITFSLA